MRKVLSTLPHPPFQASWLNVTKNCQNKVYRVSVLKHVFWLATTIEPSSECRYHFTLISWNTSSDWLWIFESHLLIGYYKWTKQVSRHRLLKQETLTELKTIKKHDQNNLKITINGINPWVWVGLTTLFIILSLDRGVAIKTRVQK